MQGLSTFLGICSSVTPLSTFSQSITYQIRTAIGQHVPSPGSPRISDLFTDIRAPSSSAQPLRADRKEFTGWLLLRWQPEASSAGSVSFSTEAETDSLLVCSLDSVLLSEAVLLEDEVLSALLSELL